MEKIAITVTHDQVEAIDRIRLQRGVPRSQVIRQALDRYLASRAAVDEADDAYEAGYRDKPEVTGEADASARMAGEVLAPEKWG
jgi:hypothetical protein